MTVFLPATPIPNPYPIENGWTSGSIAKATTDIAVVAWLSDVWRDDGATYRPMHLRAVRWTGTGPVFGPLLTITLPSTPTIPTDLASGRDLEVWVLVEVGEWNPDQPELRLAQVTVDPTTLELTLVWKHAILALDYGFGSSLSVAGELIVIATGNGSTAYDDYNVLHLVHMDDGLIETFRPPPFDEYTYPLVRAFALHESGSLLVLADGPGDSGSYARLAMAEVDALGVSDWTILGPLPLAEGTSGSYATRIATMTATPSGWALAEMSARVPMGNWRWFNVALDGTVTQGATTTDNDASNYFDRGYSQGYHSTYDPDADRAVATFTEAGAITHRIASGLTYTDQTMPTSLLANGFYFSSFSALVQVAVVGAGHYVYMVASTGVYSSGANPWDSFGVAIILGNDGEFGEIPFTRGEQAEETRRAFRRRF